MRIGIYGGSFDPIHSGHVNLVKELKKILNLSKVIVVPAFVSPFKTATPPRASTQDRLKMVQLAFAGDWDVEVSDMEIRRGGVSYTIDTVLEIAQKYPGAALFLLLTDEALPSFSRWKSYQEIQKLTTVVFAAKKKTQEIVIEIPWVDISSTIIRQKLFRGEACDEFLSPKVLDYIHEHRLYS